MEIQFNKSMLAFCGLYCEQCSFRAAYVEKDAKHLKNLPFPFEIKDVSAYNCGGCKDDLCICLNCNIKPCASQRGIDSCADCEEFPCRLITDFENDGMPHHKAAIANLHSIKENGISAWFEKIQNNLRCEQCKRIQSWYYICKVCNLQD